MLVFHIHDPVHGLLLIECQKSESSGLLGVLVNHYCALLNLTEAGEVILQLVLSNIVVETTDKNLCSPLALVLVLVQIVIPLLDSDIWALIR